MFRLNIFRLYLDFEEKEPKQSHLKHSDKIQFNYSHLCNHRIRDKKKQMNQNKLCILIKLKYAPK